MKSNSKPELSIIIPTLNEEKNLKLLLKSLISQKIDAEIIIADSNSKDKTRQIARQYNCIITPGGIPAVGRNNGARIAKAQYLLFLDADIRLKKGFLRRFLKEVKKRNLEVATCYASADSKNIFDKLAFNLANFWMWMFQKAKPFAHGFFIFCSKNIHEKIGGFNEKIVFGEDSIYVGEASKLGKFGIVNLRVYASTRRFKKEGRFKTQAKYFYYNLHRLIIGEIKNPDYKYGHYE